MKMTTYFYVDYPNGNEACGKTHMVMTDNPTEIDRAKVQYGRVFFNKPEADAFAKLPKPKRVRRLTDEERKQLELEQIAYGRSLMTETEKAEAKERKKTIDQIQLEFGRMMMRLELAQAKGRECYV